MQLGQDIDGEAANDESGNSVSLSADGNTVAIGASSNGGNGAVSGHTRVYRFDSESASWNQLGADLEGEAIGDQSGFSVSLSDDGNTVAIGAPGNDSAGFESGHTRVFRYESSSGMWHQLGQDIDGLVVQDAAGWSVSLSGDGNTVAVGAPGNDSAGFESGHTSIYRYDADTETWNRMGQDIEGEAADDSSGWSVSLSGDGNTVAIGAPYNDLDGSVLDSGHTRVFRFNPGSSTWNQLGSDIDGAVENDQSGYTVSLSEDGNTVAIGVRSGTGGTPHTRVYRFDSVNESWIQVGQNISGPGGGSGWSVSLSSDASAVANGLNPSSSGRTRVYTIQPHQISVTLDGGSDVMVTASGGFSEVKIDGVPQPALSLPVADVTDIVITGGSGSNTIDLRGVTPLAFPNGSGVRVIVDAGAGNDVIFGSEFADAVAGRSGNDLIDLNYGDDFVRGDSGNDTLLGSYGSDIILGGSGADLIDPGQGIFDIANGQGSSRDRVVQAISAGLGNVLINGRRLTQASHSLLFQRTEILELIASGGNSYIDARLSSVPIRVTITGGATILGSSGNDVVFGGDGNDVIDLGAGDDIAFGGRGSNAIRGGAGNDLLVGGHGRDTLLGGTGDDGLFGGANSDLLLGEDGADTVKGNGSKDFLTAGGNGVLPVDGDRVISTALDDVDNAFAFDFDSLL